MEIWCPFAEHRPLSNRQTEPSIVPRVFIAHTMVGYLGGTESMFKKDGYSGTESTFGLGGPWDGKSLDGVIYQWQSIDHEADAQYDGNPIATSTETSDGGNPSNPWSPKMLDSLVHLGAWWCDQTKRAPVLATAWNGTGFGYHEQFARWNKANHRCPGPVREKQYKEIVIPRIAAELHGDDDMAMTPAERQAFIKDIAEASSIASNHKIRGSLNFSPSGNPSGPFTYFDSVVRGISHDVQRIEQKIDAYIASQQSKAMPTASELLASPIHLYQRQTT